eukprot:SAG11_NODE_238_length_11818_cov_2.367693_7_plen_675_part_00
MLEELVALNDPSIFDHDVPGLLVQYKWDAYAKDIMRRKFMEYFAMTIFFTAHCLTTRATMYSLFDDSIHCEDDCRFLAVLTWILWATALALAIPVLFVAEIKSMYKLGSLWKYLEDPQNYFDMLQCLFLLLSLLLPIFGLGSIHDFDLAGSDLFRGVAIVFNWFCMLWRLMAFDRLQKLVRIIFQIVGDPNFVSFMIIVCIFLIGFAFGFYVILRNVDPLLNNIRNTWENPLYALLMSWNLMLGDFDMELLMSGHKSSPHVAVTVFLFVLFTFFITIVLFNAIIAIMGSRYEEAQTEQEERPGFARVTRARMILDLESTLTLRELQNKTTENDLKAVLVQEILEHGNHNKDSKENERLAALSFSNLKTEARKCNIELETILADNKPKNKGCCQKWIVSWLLPEADRKLKWMPKYLHVLKPKVEQEDLEVPSWAKDADIMEKLELVQQQATRIEDGIRSDDGEDAKRTTVDAQWKLSAQFPFAVNVQNQSREIEQWLASLLQASPGETCDVTAFAESCSKDLKVSSVDELRDKLVNLGDFGILRTLRDLGIASMALRWAACHSLKSGAPTISAPQVSRAQQSKEELQELKREVTEVIKEASKKDGGLRRLPTNLLNFAKHFDKDNNQYLFHCNDGAAGDQDDEEFKWFVYFCLGDLDFFTSHVSWPTHPTLMFLS